MISSMIVKKIVFTKLTAARLLVMEEAAMIRSKSAAIAWRTIAMLKAMTLPAR